MFNEWTNTAGTLPSEIAQVTVTFSSLQRTRSSSMYSNFNYKPQAESCLQQLALCMDRHQCSVAIMIEVTSCHTKCAHFNLDCSRMPAVAQ